jgi:hypothetical protein
MMYVRSKYVDATKNEYIFYVRNFRQIIEYFYLANNQNKYFFVITDEIEDDICKLDKILTTKKKNPEFDRANLKLIGTKPEHKEWCEKYSFEYEKYTDRTDRAINTPAYEPRTVARPGWAYPKYGLVFDYYRDPEFRIIHIEGLDSNWEIIPHLKNNVYVFVMICCMFAKWNFEFQRNALFTLNPTFDLNNIIWEAPDVDTMMWATEYGFDYIFCNHNCWLDWNKFKMVEMENEYDMVMNSRPERKCKRPYLAKQVSNLAYIKGHCYHKEDFYDHKELNAKFVNEERITPERVMEIYNQSLCGGIFSPFEGACYSSSEYLMCGLPVISTVGRGGRDTWFTPENSIIVEPTEEAVAEAVNTIKSMNIDKQAIRDQHIKMAQEMRGEFNKRVQLIFDMHNVNIDAAEYFDTKYVHKMRQTMVLANAEKYFN